MAAGKGLAGSLLFDRRGQIEPLVRSLCIKDSAEDRNYKEGDGRNDDGAQKKRIAPGKEKEKQRRIEHEHKSGQQAVQKACQPDSARVIADDIRNFDIFVFGHCYFPSSCGKIKLFIYVYCMCRCAVSAPATASSAPMKTQKSEMLKMILRSLFGPILMWK